MTKKKNILERLADGPVLGDGGYLLELEKRGWVRAGPFTPEVALTRPDALRELHVEFREAGADVLQALTFYASRDKLATVGLENRLEELNRAAVRIAREVAGDRCLVAGNLSLTWMYEQGSPSSYDRVRRTFDEQLSVQIEEGIDFVIGETFSWLGEALLAVERAKKTGPARDGHRLLREQDPSPRTARARPTPRARSGTPAPTSSGSTASAGRSTRFRSSRRCARPSTASSRASRSATALRRTGPDFTSLEAFPFELDPLQLSRREMAAWALRARDMGIDYIGSCCGSVAIHVREMARALGKAPGDARPWSVDYSKPMSAYEYYKHEAK